MRWGPIVKQCVKLIVTLFTLSDHLLPFPPPGKPPPQYWAMHHFYTIPPLDNLLCSAAGILAGAGANKCSRGPPISFLVTCIKEVLLRQSSLELSLLLEQWHWPYQICESAEWLKYPLTSFQALVFHRLAAKSINGDSSSATGKSSSLIGWVCVLWVSLSYRAGIGVRATIFVISFF